ncbi:type IV toxin-antitoxin system AbiEi family antitoxin domain-containing protein [Sphingopyxis sp.]|uniref:type IV toxin-antitoxin system AbiEi family antitoxin domain-containing protein n=1 Tax=Sphingopyxis sp. TaxID=1908224 RepID=UPI002B48CEFB|nr:type IV toxin-antitoxin system AbiEi family antitoxin domain-containing protein [Sphingopyxis sp.]HJS12858.1 type IV toxin-antitoxin system AbiEi family antitoxin domain-containing protein [Sphingopyxis sp.]
MRADKSRRKTIITSENGVSLGSEESSGQVPSDVLKWLRDDGGDEYLWSEDSEKPQKHRRTPAKVALESFKHSERRPRLSLRERAVELAKRNGIVRTKDLEVIGVPRQYPPMMCREGLLVRVGYGVYRAAAEGR